MESFILRQVCQEDPIPPFADSIGDSSAIPHYARWRLVLPSRAGRLAHVTEVANRVADPVTKPHHDRRRPPSRPLRTRRQPP